MKETFPTTCSPSHYFPSIPIQLFDVCKNCTLCQETWSLLFTGKRMKYKCVYFPHSMRLRYERMFTRCRHWDLNMTAHFRQVLKLMAHSVYWPVYELDDQGIVIDSRKGQEIFLSSTWFTPARVPPTFLFSGYWRLPSSAEVKNAWNCTSSTAYIFRIEGWLGTWLA